ncbi:hypothetical protein DPMN_161513 [Dreissena polymorpha]|uniref:Uncharacterized protein n=1 Tax=Dreissena polymorpha TaxID=45954 RepID=A0A9D4EPS6_DREPO|nr:hypothetical protein DPMN_161513 [Dreissena polymorpha]
MRLSISLLQLALVGYAHAQAMPSACTYNDGLYECDLTSLSSNSQIPLEASKFTPIPQRLRFWKLPASLNTAIFHTDFGSLAAADFDTNYPASLEFLCEEGASLSIATGFLTNMDYIEELKFTNCDLGGIPAAAFR